MKKIISVLIGLFMILTLGGCKTAGELKPILTDISFCAEIENSEAQILINENGVMTAEIISPESLEGLVLKLEDNGITAEYKGLKYDYPENLHPDAMQISLLYRAFRDADKNNSNVISENDGCYIKGKDYKLLLGGTGLPLSLEIKDGDKILFKNIKQFD